MDIKSFNCGFTTSSSIRMQSPQIWHNSVPPKHRLYPITTGITFRDSPIQKKTVKSAATIQVPPHKLISDAALDDLNDHVLEQCQKYLSREEAFVDEYSTLDIEKEIDQLNPTLWKAVNMLTRSASERNGRQTTSSRQKHDKNLLSIMLSYVLC